MKTAHRNKLIFELAKLAVATPFIAIAAWCIKDWKAVLVIYCLIIADRLTRMTEKDVWP